MGVPMVSNINNLKRHVFDELLNLAGRVFILVNYSEKVVIGNRGFLPEEKEKGLVLVFNHRMHFGWTADGISANLVFDSKPQKCFIPADEIVSVFSPELSAHFSASKSQEAGPHQKTSKPKIERSSGKKVVKVDFLKKK